MTQKVSLRTQCLGIAGTYTFLSSVGVFLARSLMMIKMTTMLMVNVEDDKNSNDYCLALRLK